MRIKTRKIGDPYKGGRYTIREYDDFEFVNPIHQIMNMYIGASMSFERDILTMEGFEAPEEIMEKVLFKRAIKEWSEELIKYKSIEIPANLLALLETVKKKNQINLLKGISLTSDELIAFIFQASRLSKTASCPWLCLSVTVRLSVWDVCGACVCTCLSVSACLCPDTKLHIITLD